MRKYFLNSIISGVVTSSLVFTPNLYAKTDPNANPRTEAFKKVINDSKIDSVKSYSELWARIVKMNLSPYNLARAKNLISAFNGEKLPPVKFQEFKYKGKSAIKALYNVQGEQVVVEYLFTDNEVMKINGLLITTEDVKDTATLNKKVASLPFVKKAYQEYKKHILSQNVVPSYKIWSKLSNRKKAEYLLRYRSLLEASYGVFNKGPYKLVASSRIPASEAAVKAFLFGEASFAQGEIGGKAPAGTPASQTPVISTADTPKEAADNVKKVVNSLNKDPFISAEESSQSRKGPSCIVAAYAVEWKGNTCSLNLAGNFYQKNPTSAECKTSNGNGWIACNPLVYGFNDDGKPHCINTKSNDIQYATHATGNCEKQSPLNTIDDKKQFIERWLKKVKIDGEIEKRKKDDGTYGLFTNNEKLYNAFTNEIQKPLTEYINSALKVCSAVDNQGNETGIDIETASSDTKFKYKENSKPPKNKKPPKGDPAKQDDACDALLKRAIAVKQLLETAKIESGIAIESPDNCNDWSPAGAATLIEKSCVCDMKKGFKIDPMNPKTCVKSGTDVVDVPVTPAVATVDVTEAGDIAAAADEECNWFSSFNPWNSSCKMTGSHWLTAGLAGFALLCLTETIRLDGLCGKDKKKFKKPQYIDPVDPIDPNNPLPPVTPPTSTPPTVSPRDSEGGSQTNPAAGASGSICVGSDCTVK